MSVSPVDCCRNPVDVELGDIHLWHNQKNIYGEETIRVITPEVEPGHATAGLGVLWSHRSLLWDFVQFDLKQRYTGGSLGFFWTVVTPLLELVTYTFVFHGLLGIRFEEQSGWTHYALYLFCGMVTWLVFF